MKNNTKIEDFKYTLSECLRGLTIEEIQIMGCELHKIVGDAVFDTAQAKRDLVKQFANMTDEEFETYLSNKYEPLYGENWLIKASLTQEEGDRCVKSFERKMEEWKEKQKNLPRKQNYGLKLSPRHKSIFRKY